MPSTKVLFYKELDGTIPVVEWLERQRPKRVKAKCLALVRLLAHMGHELHRPWSDGLREGIRELRTEVGNVNYRLLYFFHGKDCVILTHGITKEDEVPHSEINRAIKMKLIYQKNPDKHTYCETEQYYEESD